MKKLILFFYLFFAFFYHTNIASLENYGECECEFASKYRYEIGWLYLNKKFRDFRIGTEDKNSGSYSYFLKDQECVKSIIKNPIFYYEFHHNFIF